MENITIDSIYQKIAELIHDNIPVEWEKIRMYTEVVKHEAEIIFYFRKKGDKEFIYGHNIPKLFNISRSIYMDFLVELTRLFRQLKTFYEKIIMVHGLISRLRWSIQVNSRLNMGMKIFSH